MDIIRIDSYLYWLSLCPPWIDNILGDLSDGNRRSRARYAMSVRDPNVTALPDSYFFWSRGFRRYREYIEDNPVDWTTRSEIIRWRGSTTGQGRVDKITLDADVLPRIRLALMLKNLPGCDAAFIYSTRGKQTQQLLEQAGLWRGWLDQFTWIGDKFAVDIDGNANTWSNFLLRLHLGCCVLKVDSASGYRQWYYDRIRPWEHYVPVKADLSDLLEQIDWVRSNDGSAREIAAHGQAFARTMTLESETSIAVSSITATEKALR
ncbi:glycosyl transferase family 90 [Mesorhizobium sp. ZMM04-5]|uniref:Glycosyl transferase family 90 n=1 Tax=Mesorhizobium marinum TaxID=3228790 RepID=A0ABV3QZN5_9HYPH